MNKVISKNTLSVPAIFQKKEEYSFKDTRFTNVKIWLMHTGLNENGSFFSKEHIEKAIPTLANTPILGYLETNKRGDADFSDHRHVFKTKNGEKQYTYIGSSYGVIPETHNAHFEVRLCDDGIEREFLVVDGLMWNKLEDATEILSSYGYRNQSMELDEENYDGYFDDDNVFHFTHFVFYGACLLGMDYCPAMTGSTVELDFCNNLKNEIKNKLEIFNEYIKGGDIVTDTSKKKETEDELEKVKTEHVSDEKEEEVKTEHASDEEEEVKEETKEDDSEEEVKTEHASDEEPKEEPKEDEVKTEHASDEEPKEEPKEDDSEEKKTFNFEIEYEALKTKYSTLQSEFEKVEKENKELKEFKDSKLKEIRDGEEKALFEKYDEDLSGVTEYEKIKSKSFEFESVVDLEKEIAYVFTKNVKKSFVQDGSTRAYFENDKFADSGRYGYLAEKYKQ